MLSGQIECSTWHLAWWKKDESQKNILMYFFFLISFDEKGSCNRISSSNHCGYLTISTVLIVTGDINLYASKKKLQAKEIYHCRQRERIFSKTRDPVKADLLPSKKCILDSNSRGLYLFGSLAHCKIKGE